MEAKHSLYFKILNLATNSRREERGRSQCEGWWGGRAGIWPLSGGITTQRREERWCVCTYCVRNQKKNCTLSPCVWMQEDQTFFSLCQCTSKVTLTSTISSHFMLSYIITGDLFFPHKRQWKRADRTDYLEQSQCFLVFKSNGVTAF